LFDLPLFEISFLAFLALVLLGPKELIAFMRALGRFFHKVTANFHLYKEYMGYQLGILDTQSRPPLKPKTPIHVELALYQPEIPQNTGTLMRLGSCLNIPIHIIEPCGFVWHDQKLKRSGMDYKDKTQVIRHEDWTSFLKNCQGKRIILMDTQGTENAWGFNFKDGDIILMGKESNGVPREVFDSCAHTLSIPMAEGNRSLNMAITAGLMVGKILGR
jgi:tRNA (cytidine/uridine-2'-O-)-methyltransferase